MAALKTEIGRDCSRPAAGLITAQFPSSKCFLFIYFIYFFSAIIKCAEKVEAQLRPWGAIFRSPWCMVVAAQHNQIIYVCQIQTLLIFAESSSLPSAFCRVICQLLLADQFSALNRWADAKSCYLRNVPMLQLVPSSRLIRWHVCKMARCVSRIHFRVCQNEMGAKQNFLGCAFPCPTPPHAHHLDLCQPPLLHLYVKLFTNQQT